MIKGNFKYWTEKDYINEVIRLHKEKENKKNEDIQKRKIYRNKIKAH